MPILKIKTKGHYDFIDLTDKILELLKKTNIKSGLISIFVTGSTAALTIMEYEAGSLEDIKNVLEKWAPEKNDYEHHLKWGDSNGAAHIKSALIGPDITIPINKNKMALGTWQRITLIDFDEKERKREIIVKIIKD